jgi:hypothetical protein
LWFDVGSRDDDKEIFDVDSKDEDDCDKDDDDKDVVFDGDPNGSTFDDKYVDVFGTNGDAFEDKDDVVDNT